MLHSVVVPSTSAAIVLLCSPGVTSSNPSQSTSSTTISIQSPIQSPVRSRISVKSTTLPPAHSDAYPWSAHFDGAIRCRRTLSISPISIAQQKIASYVQLFPILLCWSLLHINFIFTEIFNLWEEKTSSMVMILLKQIF